jgi:HAD superfamily hydrolase (TIGR01509 family)
VRAPKALLVDLDGTLVDTREANFRAYAGALAEVGVAVAPARWDGLTEGRNWRQFLPGMLDGTGARPASVAARKAELYPALLCHSRVNHALAALIASGRRTWRTALVTTASAANAEAVLRHHGLETLFDLVVSGSDVERHKPFPDAYALAAERLEVAPDQCLAFEDSDVGVAAAAAFGAPCLRVCFPAAAA